LRTREKWDNASASTVIDLPTLSADYEAKNGETLTGTLAANVKISIAAGFLQIPSHGGHPCLWL